MKINTKFRRPSAAMVVAATALTVAVAGGGAFAAIQINGNSLVNKSVKNIKIANQAINNRTLEVARARARADRHEVDMLVRSLGAPELITVPALDADPVEVAGIARITRALGTT